MLIRSSLVLAFVGILSACSLSEQVAVSAVDYNSAVATSSDQILLLNIVRSSKRRPLHFSRIGQIRGSFELNAGLNASLETGDEADIFQPSASIQSSPSFDIQPLGGKAFWEGLSRPLTREQMAFFWSQGVSKSLLLHLFVEEAVVSIDGKNYCSVESVPEFGATFERFDAFAAMFADLRPEPLAVKSNTLDPKKSGDVLKNIKELLQAGFTASIDDSGQIIVSKPSNRVEFVRPTGRTSGADKKKVSVFSFSRDDSDRRPNTELIDRCDDDQVEEFHAIARNASIDIDSVKDVPIAANLSLRSVAGIFYYLGEILRAQDSRGDGEKTLLRASGYDKQGNRKGSAIIAVSNVPGQLSINYEGELFSVSTDEADRSLLTLNILHQLFNLQTEGVDFRPTQAIEFVN